MDSFRRLISKRFDLFSQILTNPDESLVHRRTLNKPESLWILGFGFANPYWFQKIRFVDSFCRPFFKDSFHGFVLWIRFWKIRFVDSFRGFVSWKQKFQITRFVSFRKDSCTNPASFIFTKCLVFIYSIICFQEEGHFAKDGNFIWNKAEKDVQDAWLDNIDWVKVRFFWVAFSFQSTSLFQFHDRKFLHEKKTYTWYA